MGMTTFWMFVCDIATLASFWGVGISPLGEVLLSANGEGEFFVAILTDKHLWM